MLVERAQPVRFEQRGEALRLRHPSGRGLELGCALLPVHASSCVEGADANGPNGGPDERNGGCLARGSHRSRSRQYVDLICKAVFAPAELYV
jgi:hypothetical protein